MPIQNEQRFKETYPFKTSEYDPFMTGANMLKSSFYCSIWRIMSYHYHFNDKLSLQERALSRERWCKWGNTRGGYIWSWSGDHFDDNWWPLDEYYYGCFSIQSPLILLMFISYSWSPWRWLTIVKITMKLLSKEGAEHVLSVRLVPFLLDHYSRWKIHLDI